MRRIPENSPFCHPHIAINSIPVSDQWKVTQTPCVLRAWALSQSPPQTGGHEPPSRQPKGTVKVSAEQAYKSHF